MNFLIYDIINVGVGEDISIGDLAAIVKDVVGYRGAIGFDPSKPEGTPRNLLDVSKLAHLGWKAEIPLRNGIAPTYARFLQHQADYRL